MTKQDDRTPRQRHVTSRQQRPQRAISRQQQQAQGRHVQRNARSQHSFATSGRSASSASRRRTNPALVALMVVSIVALAGAIFVVWHGRAGIAEDASLDTVAGTQALSVDEGEYVVESTSVTISFAGDCTLGTDEYFNYATSFDAQYESVDDPAWFFANVSSIFCADDLTVVNMEGTLTESSTRADKTYAFKGDAEYAQVLVEGGVEAACMANNHSHDYGEQSYADTVEALEEAGISTFGYDDIAYLDAGGATVALIGTYVLAEGMGIEKSMVENIEAAEAAGADVVVVYAHWGTEKSYVPDETQIELAHAAVDAGADLVIGSHPHVIQGYEKYNGRYIVYSLGNFCFGGNSHPSDMDCMIFQQTFTVTDGEVATDDDIDVIPCTVSSSSGINNYQPTPAEGDAAEEILAKIEESNEAIAQLSASLDN